MACDKWQCGTAEKSTRQLDGKGEMAEEKGMPLTDSRSVGMPPGRALPRNSKGLVHGIPR